MAACAELSTEAADGQAANQAADMQRLWDEHAGLCHKLAHKFDSEIGEAFIGLTKAWRYFRPSKGVRFSTYAWIVISNHLLSVRQRERRQLPSADAESRPERPGRDPDPSARVELAEDVAKLKAAISQLSKHQQFVVRHRLAGWSFKKIAAACGNKERNVMAIHGLGLRRLRKLIACGG